MYADFQLINREQQFECTRLQLLGIIFPIHQLTGVCAEESQVIFFLTGLVNERK